MGMVVLTFKNCKINDKSSVANVLTITFHGGAIFCDPNYTITL
jgi:hypothetical protein